MPSSNPFTLPHESPILRHSSWEPTSPIEASPSPPPTPFREVPVLPYLILQRGGLRFAVKTNSLRHAQLTGNSGSPTPIGTQPKFESVEEYARWNVGPSFTLQAAGGSAVRRSTRIKRRSSRIVQPWLSSPIGTHLSGEFEGLVPSNTEDGNVPPTPTSAPLESESSVAPRSPLAVQAPEREGRVELTPVLGDNAAGFDRSPELEETPSSPSGLEENVHITVHVVNARRANRDARARSPYDFRNRTRELVAQIRTQARVIGLPFDSAFLKEARIQGYNPTVRAKPCPRSLLHSCDFGVKGITLAEFGSILRCCMSCERYIFVGSTKLHICDPHGRLPDVTNKKFNLTSQLLLKKQFPGLSEDDLAKLFLVCDTCHRVHSTRFLAIHHCQDDDHTA